MTAQSKGPRTDALERHHEVSAAEREVLTLLASGHTDEENPGATDVDAASAPLEIAPALRSDWLAREGCNRMGGET
jgi:hypothetical protein